MTKRSEERGARNKEVYATSSPRVTTSPAPIPREPALPSRDMATSSARSVTVRIGGCGSAASQGTSLSGLGSNPPQVAGKHHDAPCSTCGAPCQSCKATARHIPKCTPVQGQGHRWVTGHGWVCCEQEALITHEVWRCEYSLRRTSIPPPRGDATVEDRKPISIPMTLICSNSKTEKYTARGKTKPHDAVRSRHSAESA